MPSCVILMKKMVRFSCVLVAFVFFSAFLEGAEYVWETSDTVWNEKNNWRYFDPSDEDIDPAGEVGHSVPGSGATARIIRSGHSPVISGAISVDTMRIDPTAVSTFSTLTVGAGNSFTSRLLTVGGAGLGTGQLNISGGGVVTSTSEATVAGEGSSKGTVSLTGTGSSWSLGSLYLGNGGTGTVTLGAGTSLSSTGTTILGNSANGNGTLSVAGTGASWTADTLIIGNNGTGTVTLGLGSTASSGSTTLGNGTDAVGSVTLTGAGVSWNTTELTVGHAGQGTLTLNPGTAVTSTDTVTIGGHTAGTGTVTLDAGTLNANKVLYVGSYGKGNLTLNNSSTLNADGTTYIGYYTGANGNLTVNAGSTVTSTAATWLGVQASSNGTATISGTNAKWNNTTLNVAQNGTGKVSILSGATMTTSGLAQLGMNAAGVGTVEVSGSGTWNTAALNVGVMGKGFLTISGTGSTVTSDGAVVIGGGADDKAGGPGTVTVNSGGVWNTKRTLEIGVRGTGTLKIDGANAKVISTGAASLGLLNSNGRGTVNLTNGATWSTTTLNVGYSNGGLGTLTIDGAGSKVTTTGKATLGLGMYSAGYVTLSDSGVWDTADLDVGGWGYGTLTIPTGTTVNTTGTATIGAAAYYANSVVHLTGGTWNLNAANTLTIGKDGIGKLLIDGSSGSSSYPIQLGVGASGKGTLEISTAGNSWTTNGLMELGLAGTGELHIRNGAVVTTNNIKIGGDIATGRGVVDVGDKFGKDTGNVHSEWVPNIPVVIGAGAGEGVVSVNNNGILNLPKQTVTVGSATVKNHAALGVEGTGVFAAKTIVGGAGKGGEVHVVGTKANITLENSYNTGGNLNTYFYVNSKLGGNPGDANAMIQVSEGTIDLDGTHYIVASGMAVQGLDSTFFIYDAGENVNYTGTYESPNSYVVSGQTTGGTLEVGFKTDAFDRWHYDQAFVYDPTFSSDPNHKYSGWVHVYPTSFATPNEHDIVWARFYTGDDDMTIPGLYDAFVDYIVAGLESSGYVGNVVGRDATGITFAMDIYHFEQQGYRLIGWNTEWFNTHYGTNISLASLSHIPEPSTWVMLLMGVGGLMAVRRRKK